MNQAEPIDRLPCLLSIEDLDPHQLLNLLDRADALAAMPALPRKDLLRGRTVMNLFFEPSTRTRVSFEVAAQRLGADVVNFDVARSSTTKGESLLDTISTLSAMQPDVFIVRHANSEALEAIAEHLPTQQSLINAGDGCRQHPTQGLLDMLTIRQHKQRFDDLKVVIVGDIRHSRVARSAVDALQILGTRSIELVAPEPLQPDAGELGGLSASSNLDQAIEGADVVMALRLQRERMADGLVPDVGQYFRDYGLTEPRLLAAHPDCIVMHPGPFNREVEISSPLADGDRSVIWNQVGNGVAVRMAVLEAATAALD